MSRVDFQASEDIWDESFVNELLTELDIPHTPTTSQVYSDDCNSPLWESQLSVGAAQTSEGTTSPDVAFASPDPPTSATTGFDSTPRSSCSATATKTPSTLPSCDQLTKAINAGYFLSIPDDGRKCDDIWVVPNFLQSFAPGKLSNPDEIWKLLLTYPVADSTKPAPYDKTGMTPLWVLGDNPSLKSRGNVLKRHKMWLQKDFAKGLLKYKYPGYTNAISRASRDVKAIPHVEELMNWLNAFAPKVLEARGMPASGNAFKSLNHAIVTRYDDENDHIPNHSDKDAHFASDSYFVVLKFGATRKFEFVLPGKRERSVMCEDLPAGSAVFVRAKSTDGTVAGNDRVKHGVPVVKGECGPSGSIVFRSIQTRVPWSTTFSKIDASTKAKLKRDAKKAGRFRAPQSKIVHNSETCRAFLDEDVRPAECVLVGSARGMRLCTSCIKAPTTPSKRKRRSEKVESVQKTGNVKRKKRKMSVEECDKVLAECAAKRDWSIVCENSEVFERMCVQTRNGTMYDLIQ